MTGNGEREYPPPFLRRCALPDIPAPDAERLVAVAAAHFRANLAELAELVAGFEQRARVGGLAADQLLNAVRLAVSGAFDGDQVTSDELLDMVWYRLTPASGPG